MWAIIGAIIFCLAVVTYLEYVYRKTASNTSKIDTVVKRQEYFDKLFAICEREVKKLMKQQVEAADLITKLNAMITDETKKSDIIFLEGQKMRHQEAIVFELEKQKTSGYAEDVGRLRKDHEFIRTQLYSIEKRMAGLTRSVNLNVTGVLPPEKKPKTKNPLLKRAGITNEASQ